MKHRSFIIVVHEICSFDLCIQSEKGKLLIVLEKKKMQFNQHLLE